MLKKILLFFLLFIQITLAQSLGNSLRITRIFGNNTTYAGGAVGDDTTWITLTEFTQCKKDSQLITNENDRTFEVSETCNWISSACSITGSVHYEGSYSYGFDGFGGGESESFTLTEDFIGEPLNGTVFDPKDSLIIQFHYYLDGNSFDPSRLFSPYNIPLLTAIWDMVTIVRCPPRSPDSSYAMIFDFIEQEFSPWMVAIDDLSMIWRKNFNCYKITTTEPTVVKVDEVVYTKSNSTKEYTESSKWSYSDGILYVGVNPSGKTIKVTY